MRSGQPLPTDPMPEDACRQLSAQLLDAALHSFGDGLTGATVKGSAIKGGFIPHYSDFDLHLFVDAVEVPMLDARTPALEAGLTFQAASGHLRPADFAVSSIQVYIVDDARYPSDWTPPLPGTYRLIYGRLPDGLPPVTEGSLRDDARGFFQSVAGQITRMVGRIVDKPDDSLAPYVRLLGTGVKPAVYHAAVLMSDAPLNVWQRLLADLLPEVEDRICPSGAFSQFFAHAASWQQTQRDPAALRHMFRAGCQAMEEAAEWADGLEDAAV